MLSVILSGIIGIVLLVVALLIKFGKKINIISAINDERREKIKKVDKVTSDFGNRMFLLSFAFLITAGASYILGRLGSIIGLIIIIIAAAYWNNLCMSIDEKIKRREY